jgi:hypothetical protein
MPEAMGMGIGDARSLADPDHHLPQSMDIQQPALLGEE